MGAEGWTGEEISTLRQGSLLNWSARRIADTIGRTRNAIIGKAHRIGIVLGGGDTGPIDMEKRRKRKAAAQARYEARRRVRVRTQYPVLLLVNNEPTAPHSPPITLLDLRSDTCRWPVDSPTGPLLYCGAPAAIERPYCPYHCGMAYRRRGE